MNQADQIDSSAPSFPMVYAIAAFGSLLLPGILNAGVVPQELSLIMKEFGLTETTFMKLAASIAIIAVFLGLTAAKLVPKFGAYNVCLMGYFIFACGIFGVVFSPYPAMAAFCGIYIAWGMAYLHMGNGLVVTLAPQKAARMTNLLHGLNALGKAVGPTFALIGTGWRASFAALGCVALLLGITGCFGIPKNKKLNLDRKEETKQDPQKSASVALQDPLFWGCALLFAPILGMELTVTLWLPKYLQLDFGLTEVAGEDAAYTAASIMLWTMCCGRFLSLLVLKYVPAIGYLLISMLGTLGLFLGTEYGWWTGTEGMITMVLFGLGCSAAWPTFFAISCRFYPHHAWLFAIVSGAATTLAWIIFGSIGGIIGTKYGLIWTLRMAPVLGVIVAVGACVLYWIGVRRDLKTKAEGNS